MTSEYNWKAILAGAVPVSIVLFSLYYTNIAKGIFNFYLILGIVISIGITYYLDKKKQNVFTSPFLVLIVAFIIQVLKNLGII
jgi:uncharacterized membrane protein